MSSTKTEAIKQDAGKPTRPELLPADALLEISKVLKFGAEKYAAENWRGGLHFKRVYGAALRHLFAWFLGEDNDPETGLSHLAHAGCCILFLLAFVLDEAYESFDDRP